MKEGEVEIQRSGRKGKINKGMISQLLEEGFCILLLSVLRVQRKFRVTRASFVRSRGSHSVRSSNASKRLWPLSHLEIVFQAARKQPPRPAF